MSLRSDGKTEHKSDEDISDYKPILFATNPDLAMLNASFRPSASTAMAKGTTLTTAAFARPPRTAEPHCNDEVNAVQYLIDEIELYGVPQAMRPVDVRQQRSRTAGGELKLNRQRNNANGELRNIWGMITGELIRAQVKMREIQELNWLCANYAAAMAEQRQEEDAIRRDEDTIEREYEKKMAELKKRKHAMR